MSTDKVSGDSRFDAGLRRLAVEIDRLGNSQGCIITKLEEYLLPLLEKIEILLNTNELDPIAWAAAKAALRKALVKWGG